MQTFNQTRHDHEITIEKQTVIEECPDDEEAATIPQIMYHVSPSLPHIHKLTLRPKQFPIIMSQQQCV